MIPDVLTDDEPVAEFKHVKAPQLNTDQDGTLIER
jgi:hypothetical protein